MRKKIRKRFCVTVGERYRHLLFWSGIILQDAKWVCFLKVGVKRQWKIPERSKIKQKTSSIAE